jgi:hypothetical protein
MLAVPVLAVLIAQAVPPPRDVKPVATAPASISGVVLSDEQPPRPLRRARVTLNGEEMRTLGRTVITGDEGAFAFEDVPPGNYELTAVKNGYVSMDYGASRAGRPGRAVDVAAGEARRVELRLPRGAVITGAVLDQEGQPVQGIAVMALSRHVVGPRPVYRESGSPALPTDDTGTYRIYGLPAGDYVVVAQGSTRVIGFPPGETVRAMSRGEPSARRQVMARTFYPSTADVGQAARLSVTAGEERSGIDIQLDYVPLASVSGTARVDADWTPPQVSLVRVDDLTTTGMRDLSVRAGADGAFSFDGIPPGQYRLVARTALSSAAPAMTRTPSGATQIAPPVQLAGLVDITVAGEDVADLSLSMQPALTMTGRVEFAGRRPPFSVTELPGATPASFAMVSAGQRFPLLSVASDGTFRAAGIEPGLYQFIAGHVGGGKIGEWWVTSLLVNGADVLDAPFDIRQNINGAVATISDRASTLTGVVRNASGDAFTHVTVVAFSTDRSTWAYRSRRIAAVDSDDEGRYVIRNLPPGEYRVVATTDLEPLEWFDPAVLERLLPAGLAVAISGAETVTRDLVVR